MQSKTAVFSFIAAVALSGGTAGAIAGPVGARSALDRDIELELLLTKPPVPDDSRLGAVLASLPHNVSMMDAGNRAKSSPATSPSAYAAMVFTAVTPCRILDSRASQGGAGPWAGGSTNSIKIGPYPAAGGGYSTGAGAQGGSATGCGLDALAGPGKIAVIMVAVSTVAQASAGYLTFFSSGAPNPGATSVSQFYQPGYVQTSFVLIPSDLIGAVTASGFSSATTDVIIDVAGYFAAAPTAVTSITAGTGLTGGTITSTGTIAVATAYQLPQACATNQIPKWSGAAWTCAADANSGGTVSAVSASAPLASSGGNAPNISLTGTVSVANGGTGQASLATNGIIYGQGTSPVGAAVGTTGDVLTGTAGAPAWTGSPSISGNLTLATPSTPSAGNIMKGGNRFIHNFGPFNVFIGENAGNFTMTGNNNTAIGVNALTSNTTGSFNSASGTYALASNTSGGNNTASGFDALLGNTAGVANTASGAYALLSNTTGGSNTASGASALQSNTTGFQNTASGAVALFSNTTGNANTAIGWQALAFNATGTGNIGIGFAGGQNLTTGSNNIDIGNLGIAAEAGTIRIGTSGTQTATFIAGISGATSAGGVGVFVNGSGQLGTITSSRRFKDDIADMDTASSALMRLRPVTFHYKTDQDPAGRTLQYGLVAEEVAEVYPGLIARSRDGQVETVMYQFLPPMLLNEYQKQQRRIEMQTSRIEAQARKIELQTTRIAELETQTSRIVALERLVSDMGEAVSQLRRSNSITASLPSR